VKGSGDDATICERCANRLAYPRTERTHTTWRSETFTSCKR
jgi:hypothetical protein